MLVKKEETIKESREGVNLLKCIALIAMTLALIDNSNGVRIKGFIYNRDGKFIYRPPRSNQAHIIVIDNGSPAAPKSENSVATDAASVSRNNSRTDAIKAPDQVTAALMQLLHQGAVQPLIKSTIYPGQSAPGGVQLINMNELHSALSRAASGASNSAPAGSQPAASGPPVQLVPLIHFVPQPLASIIQHHHQQQQQQHHQRHAVEPLLVAAPNVEPAGYDPGAYYTHKLARLDLDGVPYVQAPFDYHQQAGPPAPPHHSADSFDEPPPPPPPSARSYSTKHQHQQASRLRRPSTDYDDDQADRGDSQDYYDRPRASRTQYFGPSEPEMEHAGSPTSYGRLPGSGNSHSHHHHHHHQQQPPPPPPPADISRASVNYGHGASLGAIPGSTHGQDAGKAFTSTPPSSFSRSIGRQSSGNKLNKGNHHGITNKLLANKHIIDDQLEGEARDPKSNMQYWRQYRDQFEIMP